MSGKCELSPTGSCWCGCGEATEPESFFVRTHDRKAEAAVIRVVFGGIPQFLDHYGFGPGRRNPIGERAALEATGDELSSA